MSLGIVIFARMDSSRLPEKALLPLRGKPLLAWTMERCQASRIPVFLATTEREIDTPLVDLARGYGVTAYRGDTSDVLGRALLAAEHFGLQTLVRISGDSPFIPPDLINLAVSVHTRDKPDLTTNVCPRTYPPGISVEVIERQLLQRLSDEATTAREREHVTCRVYDRPDKVSIVNITSQAPHLAAGLHLAVDTADDYHRAVDIAERLSSRLAGLEEIIDCAEAQGRDVKQKESV